MDDKVNLTYNPGDTVFHLHVPFGMKDKVKEIGGTWHQATKSWTFPVDVNIWESIKDTFGGHGDLLVQRSFLKEIERIKGVQAEFMAMRALAEEDNPVDYGVKGISYEGKNPLLIYQKWGVTCGWMAEDGFLIGDSPGLGKGLVPETGICTPEGMRMIGEIRVGDQVIGSDGKPVTVTGVFPQPAQQLYEVSFTDGFKAVCDSSHLWTVMKGNSSVKKTFSVGELLSMGVTDASGAPLYRVPVLTGPVQFSRRVSFSEEPSLGHPYFAGSLLASLKKTDGEKEYLRQYGYAEDRLPPDLMYSADALNLYYGMMRSGGHSIHRLRDKVEDVIFIAPNEGILKGFRELCGLLGFVTERKNSLCPSVIVRVPKKVFPFLTKKKTHNVQIKKTQDKKPRRWITSVRPAGFGRTVCISVDAPDKLYVIENGIVTHNTIQALAIALERRNRGEISNCLIVCLASLKYNWLNEIEKFTQEKALVIDGSKDERVKKWNSKGYFFKIVNYEAIVNDIFVDTDVKRKAVKNLPPAEVSWRKQVQGQFDMVVVDEIHAIKHHTSQRTLALKQLRARYRLGLSGTPVDGKLEQLHSIFGFLKPGLFESRAKFMEHHAILDFFGSVRSYIGVSSVREKILPYYIRRVKEKVLKDLPEKIYKDVYVELHPAERKIYKDLISGAHEITSEEMAATRILRVRQFLDFPEILEGLRNPSWKFQALSDLLEELIDENQEKVLIFTQYKEVLDLLFLNLKKRYKILQIHGLVDAKERFELVEMFNNDKKWNILMGTDAMSTGLNIGGANSVIHYEDNFSPAMMNQRTDRAHRATTRHNVTVYRFICKDTIEERVRKAIETKMDLNNAVLDEKNDELGVSSLTNIELLQYL